MPTQRFEPSPSTTEREGSVLAAHGHIGGSKLLRLPAVTARVGMKRTLVYGLIKEGKFPAPVKIGKASAWLDDEITQWIQSLKQEREASKRSP